MFSSCMMQILLSLPPSALVVTQMCCTVPNTDLYHFILDCRHQNINNVCNIGVRDETKCSVILVFCCEMVNVCKHIGEGNGVFVFLFCSLVF
jgi:hypothetical protein